MKPSTFNLERRGCFRPTGWERVIGWQCLQIMDPAAHYRDQAGHARQLADAAWQLDLADMLRGIAKDYDERAEYIETRQVRAMASQGKSFTTGQ
jgi:hypothetical protein